MRPWTVAIDFGHNRVGGRVDDFLFSRPYMGGAKTEPSKELSDPRLERNANGGLGGLVVVHRKIWALETSER